MKKLFNQTKSDNEDLIFPIIAKHSPEINDKVKCNNVVEKPVNIKSKFVNTAKLNHSNNSESESQESITSRLKRLETILDETGLQRLEVEKEQKLQQINALDNQIKTKQAQLENYEKTLKKFEDESVENYRKKIQAYNLRFNTDLVNK